MAQLRPGRRHMLRWVMAALLLALSPVMGPGRAAAMAELTVVGAGGERVYGMAELRDLGTAEIRTSTPWTEGVETFTGVPLARLLGDDAPAGGTLRLIALNDYEGVIPVADIELGTPVIAYWRNGSPMSIRDKGPFWVVFPFDEDERYNTEQVYSRSVWQLVRIVIEP